MPTTTFIIPTWNGQEKCVRCLEHVAEMGTRPQLPPHLHIRELDRGRWLVYLHREEVNTTLNSLNLSEIDDFRLYSVTLEDLYLHYAGVGE